jgi:VanZ family protein
MRSQPTSPRQPSLLPHCLALLYALSIAYASLQPFSPWMWPQPGTPFFLFAWQPRLTRYDVVVNVLAYAPLGLFIALVPRRASPARRALLALATGAALSFALETLQMLVPPRDANSIDFLGNAAGALLGGLAAAQLARTARARESLHALRERWFLPGHAVDVGIALVAIWLAAQVNPGIPLFATMFDASPHLADANGAPATRDAASIFVEAAHSGFQLLGVGLFVGLLLRERRHVGGAVFALVGAALLVKGVAATLLLKPAAWEQWLSPGVSYGVAAGALALTTAIFAPRAAQAALATIALLSSLLVTLLAPDMVFARAPLSLFNWSYGHLLNFNGLTRTVLIVWPIAASAFLFALAGRPGWGAAGARPL